MTDVTFDFSQDVFITDPSNATAAVYLATAMEYFKAGMIGRLTLYDVVHNIIQYLEGNL